MPPATALPQRSRSARIVAGGSSAAGPTPGRCGDLLQPVVELGFDRVDFEQRGCALAGVFGIDEGLGLTGGGVDRPGLFDSRVFGRVAACSSSSPLLTLQP